MAIKLCFLTLFWSLLCNLLYTLLQTIAQRCLIGVEKTEHVPVEPKSLNDDVNDRLSFCSRESSFAEQGERFSFKFVEPKCEFMESFSDEKFVSDSVISDAKMRTEHSVSALIVEDSQSPESESDPSTKLNEDSIISSVDEIGVDLIQQHQDLVQKMEMEIKQGKSRGGLPTILEDCVSPRVAEDLKPLIINDKIDHKDLLEHVHKFYKSYADKMLKLDILNQQTLHALNLLLENMMIKKKKKKFSMRSVFPTKCRRPKVSCGDDTAAEKSVRDLIAKLELIYVGQLCLSWEILNWQHGKALELQKVDRYAFRHYNQVADEFQQFQVMLQTCVEDEAFQSPSRVKRYVENRDAFRGFLHVPCIKDDCLRDKKAMREEVQHRVTISALIRIIHESRIAFHKFLGANKQEGKKPFIQDQSNQDLCIQAQTMLHKKEKMVKEPVRSKCSCICMGKKKKMRNSKEPGRDEALFLAQVELKLVRTVLSMSEISRDQILWCHNKLEKINLVDKLEPTFLLFPF
ncbi:hypothetical protein QQ045_016821 [Rhodiola kirilowii]